MFVRDCMTPDPKTVEPDTSLDEALGLMRALRVRHLPVVHGASLVGILTWTDLMRASPSPATTLAVWEIPALLKTARVQDVMTRDPLTVSPEVPVEIAARMLRDRKIGSLPVMERQMLVGIVTESDLFDALIFLLGGDIHGVRMSVELPNGLRDLARLVDALSQLTSEKGAVTVSARLDEVSRRGYVRVATSSPLVLAEHLATAGFEVSNLRFEPLRNPFEPYPDRKGDRRQEP